MDRQSAFEDVSFFLSLLFFVFFLRSDSDLLLAAGLLGELSDAVFALVRKPAARLGCLYQKKSQQKIAGSDSRFDLPEMRNLMLFRAYLQMHLLYPDIFVPREESG